MFKPVGSEQKRNMLNTKDNREANKEQCFITVIRKVSKTVEQ